MTLTVQGTPQQMSVDLSSSEQGSREEIATALFGGGVTTGNAFTLLSGELLGVTGQRLGLDALRLDVGGSPDEFREDPGQVQQDLDDPVTRLTLSKRIRDNVEFTVSQNLRENGRATFVVSYFPIGNFEVRAVSRDNSSFGIGLRHQVTFGGTRVTRPEVVRAEVRVARVEFEGELAPLTEAGLHEMIRVRAGEAFSFYDWQQDLDGLTAAYVERGFYEARVRGRRVDQPDGSIVVVCAVSRGPATRIVVEGAQIPEDEIEAIREAWTRAVFDRFLVQDAENRLRRTCSHPDTSMATSEEQWRPPATPRRCTSRSRRACAPGDAASSSAATTRCHRVSSRPCWSRQAWSWRPGSIPMRRSAPCRSSTGKRGSCRLASRSRPGRKRDGTAD